MTTEQVSGAGRRPRASLRALLACGVATIVTVGLAGSAAAYDTRWFAEPGYAPQQQRPQTNWQQWQQQRYYYQQQQQQRPAAPVVQQQAPQQVPAQQAKKAPPPPEKPKGPLTIIVSIKQQHVTLFASGEQVGRAPVSTGVVGHLTPMGVFSVIEKDRYHHSNIYSGAPMPFMQRLTMSGVALHEGFLPGYPASHGCIRMPGDFAAKLWDLTELGVRVIVSPEDVSPVAISSPYLFVAKKPGPSPVAFRDPVPTAKIRLASADATDAATLPAQPAEQAEPSAAAPAPAETPAEPQPLAAQPATTEPAAAAATAPAPESAAAPAADEPTTTGTVAVKPATMPEPVAAATDDDAGRAVTDLILAEQAKLAAQRAKDAEADKAAAYAQAKAGLTEKSKVAQSGKEFPEKPGPITVFISRQTGKLYVRKGFWPVFETAVKIADPDRPFGTHVFTALEAQGDEGAFRWHVVSIPNSAKTQAPQPAVNKFGNAAPQLISHGAVDPATVLERITIPAEALDRISSLMTSGASLILSDFAMSYETAPRGTDFVVLVPN